MRSLGTLCCGLLLAACAADLSSPDETTTSDDATVRVRIERGVDRASVLSVREARILHIDHGVRWTGVYIGGACNGGSGWTKAAVENIHHATGWQFMPIWVGQQSPSICGAHALNYWRGKSDGAEAAHRMHQMGWGANRDIPVALDVEAGTYFYSPGGSTSYVRGWVRAVRAAGYRPYVYGSPYGINHFHDAGVRIDGVWAASYFYSGFRAVKPGDLTQMGSRYRHHNRAWQYAGNFYVSGVGDVDANTSNLLLAPAPGGTNRVKTAARELPASCGVLEEGEGLARGEAAVSCDGATTLTLSDSGELALAVDGKVTWTAGTEGAGETAVMQDTGELAVYDADGEIVFTTDTAGFPGAHVVLAAGMTLVDDDDAATPLWSSANGLLVTDEIGPLASEVDEP
jgi:hypothetical protein